MMIISMIAAMSENRVIGKDNKLPWHIPDDLKHFKNTTLGKPVIMGRKTFESMGSKPLPNRLNIVLTQDKHFQAVGCIVVHSIDQALEAAKSAPEVMIIGGQKIYQQFLPLAARLYLSIVHRTVEGDTFFPELNEADWELSHEIPGDEFTIQVLMKKSKTHSQHNINQYEQI